MPVPARMSLVTLGVADVPRAAAFYEALGWRRSSASVEGEVAFFQLGAMALALWGLEELAADAGVEASQPRFRGIAMAMNLESADAVDEALRSAGEAGA